MTNSKFRIKSEIRNPNGKLWRPMSSFGHLSFVILSTFVIRISSFSSASSRRLLQAMNKTNIEHPTSNAEHRSRTHAPAQPSTFDVQYSAFDVRPFAYERSSLRPPPVAEEPRLHRRCRAHARAGHRDDGFSVQSYSRRTFDTASIPEAGANRPPHSGED